MPDRRTPFTVADERTTLLDFLRYLRESVCLKAIGLPEADARRALVPSGTSVLGLVKHLTMADTVWFQHRLGGLDVRVPPDTLADDDTIESVVAAYRAAAAVSDDVVLGIDDLDQVCARTDERGPLTARWVLVHMVEETARHAGHADILREQLDGSVGR